MIAPAIAGVAIGMKIKRESFIQVRATRRYNTLRPAVLCTHECMCSYRLSRGFPGELLVLLRDSAMNGCTRVRTL